MLARLSFIPATLDYSKHSKIGMGKNVQTEIKCVVEDQLIQILLVGSGFCCSLLQNEIYIEKERKDMVAWWLGLFKLF